MEQPKKSLAIFIHKLQLSDSSSEEEGVCCCLLLDSKFFEVIELTPEKRPITIPYTSFSQHLQLTFKRKNESQLLGCVRILFDSLKTLECGTYSQWLTLFDNPEDDVFDGAFGEDDTEYPRALLTIQLQDETQLLSEASQSVSGKKIQLDQCSHSPDKNQNIQQFDDLLSKISPLKEPKTSVFATAAEQGSGETVESLKKLLSQRDKELKEAQLKLKKQAEYYEEQFENTHKKNIDLEFRILEQETLIEELREQIVSFNQIENQQTLNEELSKQIKEEMTRYKSTVDNLESMLDDLQNRYEASKKREQELGNQYKKALEKNEEQEQKLKLALSDYNAFKKEGESRISELKQALEYNRKLLISDNLEILMLKAQLQLAQEAIPDGKQQLRLPQTHASQTKEELIQPLAQINHRSEKEKEQTLLNTTSIAQDHSAAMQAELRYKAELIKELQAANKELDLKNKLLEEKLNVNAIKAQQLEDYRRNAQYYEKEKEILREELLKVNSSYVKLTDKYVELTNCLANIKSANTSALDCSQHQETDEMELKLTEALAQADASHLEYRKISEGVYSIDNRKLQLSLQKGNLYLKDNEISVPLVEYLKSMKKKDELSETFEKIEKIEEKVLEPESRVLVNTMNAINLRTPQQQHAKSSNISEKSRGSVHSITKESQNISQVLSTEENVENKAYKTMGHLRTTSSAKKGAGLPKSAEKKTSSNRKPQTGINSPSFSLLKPRNFRDMSPILSGSKHNSIIKSDSNA